MDIYLNWIILISNHHWKKHLGEKYVQKYENRKVKYHTDLTLRPKIYTLSKMYTGQLSRTQVSTERLSSELKMFLWLSTTSYYIKQLLNIIIIIKKYLLKCFYSYKCVCLFVCLFLFFFLIIRLLKKTLMWKLEERGSDSHSPTK